MSGCELSPSASAFSSMLSAFVGSVFNGLFSGYFIAFFTGWISWFAVIRILAAGFYEWYLTIKVGTNVNAPDEAEYQSIGMNMLNGGAIRSSAHPTETQPTSAAYEQARPQSETNLVPAHTTIYFGTSNPRTLPFGARSLLKAFSKGPKRDVTSFGWLGWAWSALYTPISQSIWVSASPTSGHGPADLVRALAIAVSALGLTFDYKQRYAASIGRKWGSWAFVAFNAWNSTACLLLGAEATFLLCRGALNTYVPLPFLIIYPIFSIIWAVVSWKSLPPIDGARPGWNIFLDFFMGAFAGLFCAAPAFALWRTEQFDSSVSGHFGPSSSEGMDLGSYLNCEQASFWEKFAAIMP